MDFKPLLTYTGDTKLFLSLESQIVTAMPTNTCEWKRSYGRPVKNVRMEARFQQVDQNLLEKYKKGMWSILEHPVLHIFITECNDLELYKSTVKGEIITWLSFLQVFNVVDWMIVVVETLDLKKTKNILPRTTVLDKIRTDFGQKNEDRCISVLNPLKFEMKATESFRCLLQRIRYLMLSAYNRNIGKYEEMIRAHRERRNQEKWDFINYFCLQEQLAFVLEMLGLHSEALIQYDELDAMFSQFVLNSVIGEKPAWMGVFEKQFQSFQGISLDRNVMCDSRKKIEAHTVSLLQFRSYLFGRQCILLRSSGRPWEIAQRLLGFLFATLREMETLKLEMPPGALASWQFVCALEVLKICDEAAETDETNKCFQDCAPIWNLAKDKLYELGKLCGLLPGCSPSSEQLHIVVQLSAGIGDTITSEDLVQMEAKQYLMRTHSSNSESGGSRSQSPSAQARTQKPPTERLKEALGSNPAFQRLYLELSELAISTFKHVSRLRSARLVGLDLGNFYCSLNEPQKAVVFFTDLLRELKAENWNYLASQSLLELASCYQKLGDLLSYTKTCGAVACCTELEILVRFYYFDEFLKSMKELKSMDEEVGIKSNLCVLEDHFKVKSVKLKAQNTIIQDQMIEVELTVESNFPREIISDRVAISFEGFTPKSGSATSDMAHEHDKQSNDNRFAIGAVQPMSLYLSYKQDNALESASVVCEQRGKPVRRSSSTRRKISPTTRHDFTNAVANDSVMIKPGTNVITLMAKATRVGQWAFKQLSIEYDNMDFVSSDDGLMVVLKNKTFEIITKPSAAALIYDQPLYAGIKQQLLIRVTAGSFVFPAESNIVLKGMTKSLCFRTAEHDEAVNRFEKELNVTMLQMKSFEVREIPLEVVCDLPSRREDKPIEHSVELSVPWSRNAITIPLSFSPSMTATCRLHTSGIKKFLQVIVKGVVDATLILSDTEMRCHSEGIELLDLNPKSQREIAINKDLTVSYLWEIQIEPLKTENEQPVIQVNFRVNYAPIEGPSEKRPYSCTFDVTDYATLFRIHAKVETASELCRVSSVCTLSLKISKIQENPFTDLMYEVMADQNTWAVCGRSSGVVSMQNVQQQVITLEVLPLTAGFLALPTIRIMKYVQLNKEASAAMQPKLQPFPPGQIYNSTKSMQIHVLASNITE